jgi:hypothetical protein
MFNPVIDLIRSINPLKRILQLIFIGMVALLMYSGLRMIARKSNQEQIIEKIEAVQNRLETIKAKDGRIAYSAPVNVSSEAEVKTLRTDLMKEIQNLNIRLKQAQQFTKVNTEFHLNTTTKVHDSIAVDSVKIKVFEYEDKFNRIHGLLIGDSVKTDILVRDSLSQVVYWKRSWFLGRKHYCQIVTSSNPCVQVKYLENLTIRRKHGLF